MTFYNERLGTWSPENNLAVFREPFRDAVHYSRASLETAIQNVKSNRHWYATYEAYERDWFHFERGLALFKSVPAST